LNKIFNLIGLAKKAGKVSNGTIAAKESLNKGKAYLLVMSNDIASNTKEELLKYVEKKKTPWIIVGSKYELGNSVGKEYRVAVTINDFGIAQALIKESECIGLNVNSVGVV
jgi:ribosomal protein L7Ae-like RNA K-turn-binding protein